MTNLLLAHRQKAHLLNHELWVAQRTDCNWQVWIEGKKSLRHETVFPDQDEAKRAAHSLAHRHIEGKQSCDCARELLWELIQPHESIVPEERRTVARFPCSLKIQWQDRGFVSAGRFGNLSAEGAFIRTPNPAPEGSVLKLSFQAGTFQVEARGEVIYRLPDLGMGVRFLDLSLQGHEAIASFIGTEEE
jgi:hypothetical protein